jgi:3-deoxy-D-manno-octulosonate 8-phosphate phosphatase (KDO 8-P phosphatase)
MQNTPLTERLRAICLLAMDVDGVLTDGSIGWASDATGSLTELKSFHVKDGLGISLALAAGFQVAWITGRVSPIVHRRAEELGVREVIQRARDKRASLQELLHRLGLRPEQALYVGDDLNDLPAFDAVGVRVAVADASELVRARADWVTAAPGGKGAVREVVEGVLATQARLDEAVAAFLARLREEQRQGAARPGQ